MAITNYGGVIHSIRVPDRAGAMANVALGFASLDQYLSDFTRQPWPLPGGSGNTYFGAIVGRYANRIAGASFSLSGRHYELPANQGPNCMHGGEGAWSMKVWVAEPEEGPDYVALRLTYTDPAGANGFPGKIDAEVTYALDDDGLRIEYAARTDEETVLNLTNHTYFNLAGEGAGSVYEQLLRIDADRFTPLDDNLIPTGEFAQVEGTPFDFRQSKPIGADLRRADLPRGEQLALAHGYDHNWVPNGAGLRLVAEAEDPGSGRVLRVRTDQPGLQFYTANFLVGDLVGPAGRAYRQGDAFALETQHYPDSPHHLGDPEWPSVVLEPGSEFRSTTVYEFSTRPVARGRNRARWLP